MSAPSPWRWQPFAPGLEVYTRDPQPPPGEPFTGRYRGSADTEGRWRVYPDEDAAEPAAQGQARGATVEERMGAAREAVALWVAAPGLRERVAALEEALSEALDGWEGTVSDVGFTSYHTIKRLRALLSEGAGAAGKGEGES